MKKGWKRYQVRSQESLNFNHALFISSCKAIKKLSYTFNLTSELWNLSHRRKSSPSHLFLYTISRKFLVIRKINSKGRKKLCFFHFDSFFVSFTAIVHEPFSHFPSLIILFPNVPFVEEEKPKKNSECKDTKDYWFFLVSLAIGFCGNFSC